MVAGLDWDRHGRGFEGKRERNQDERIQDRQAPAPIAHHGTEASAPALSGNPTESVRGAVKSRIRLAIASRDTLGPSPSREVIRSLCHATSRRSRYVRRAVRDHESDPQPCAPPPKGFFRN